MKNCESGNGHPDKTFRLAIFNLEQMMFYRNNRPRPNVV